MNYGVTKAMDVVLTLARKVHYVGLLVASHGREHSGRLCPSRMAAASVNAGKETIG